MLQFTKQDRTKAIVVRFASGEAEADWQTTSVHDRGYLAGQSASSMTSTLYVPRHFGRYRPDQRGVILSVVGPAEGGSITGSVMGRWQMAIEDEELPPIMKLKCSFVNKRCASEIEAVYGGARAAA